MTFTQLQNEILKMDTERNWLEMDASDLAKSIMIESAELLEHFQWDNTIEKRGDIISNKKKDEIGYEAADVLIYLIKFCRVMDIDILKATEEKLEIVLKKYPTT